MKQLIFLSLLLLLFSCNRRDDQTIIPIAGTKNGLSQKEIDKKLSPTLKKSITKIIRKLDAHKSESNAWKLKRVTVGLFLVGEAELTENYKVEVEPSLELRFEQLQF